MTDLDFRPQRRRAPARIAVLLAGAAGAAALLLLALAGRAEPAPAAAAAALVFVLAIAAAVWLGREEGAEPPSRESDPAPAPVAPRAEAPYDDVIEALPEPLLLVESVEPDDAAGPRILFANGAARELLRLQRQGGLLAAALRNPAVLEMVDEALFGRIQTEAFLQSGGAQERVWRVVAKPLAAEGHRHQALIWMRDETDARRNERMRADFLANASHELRTPLASLSGFIETLRGHAKEDAAARDRFLAIMSAQAERMSRLIDDLMSLSRIELNEHIPPSGEVDLNLAVTDVVDALGPLAAERGVRLETQLAPKGEAVVAGDRDQIIQVAQNLIDNAMKYSTDGGTVAVEVSAGLSQDQAIAPRRINASRLSLLSPDHALGRRYAALTVIDSGPGIAREQLPRLSERFYRVEGQKSGERAGTGLGLAIVKHVMNRHRGGLAVESAEGEGAAFTAYFPMPAPASAHAAEETAAGQSV